MRILACHNSYLIRGGEDQAFEDEVALLREYGHEVATYTRRNEEIEHASRASVVKQSFWSNKSASEVERATRDHRADVVHFTNTFPLISHSAYGAARRGGAAVVQSLHNYRWTCSGGYLMRDGKVCEDCLGRTFGIPAVRHKCYRDSRAGSLVVAGLHATHRLLGTWQRNVDAFSTVSEFARRKLIDAGVPGERFLVKPNCVHPDPGFGPGDGGYAVFAGRLSPEKGLATLMQAWDRMPSPVPLRILGDGPMKDEVARFASERSHVEFLGRKPFTELLGVVGRASLLVMPSVWYETFGRTIIEAYATGTPVVASRLGAMEELVVDGQTGFAFEAGNAADLANNVERVLSLPDETRQTMRQRCRREYEQHYTPDQNYQQLMRVYHTAMEHREASKAAAARPVEQPRAV